MDIFDKNTIEEYKKDKVVYYEYDDKLTFLKNKLEKIESKIEALTIPSFLFGIVIWILFVFLVIGDNFFALILFFIF